MMFGLDMWSPLLRVSRCRTAYFCSATIVSRVADEHDDGLRERDESYVRERIRDRRNLVEKWSVSTINGLRVGKL